MTTTNGRSQTSKPEPDPTIPSGVTPATDMAAVTEIFRAIEANIRRVVSGKPEVSKLAIIALLAEGHLLIEDVPGVGKTMLARALARSINCSVSRIQFTPDLLPSDITGITVYSPDTGDFTFRSGPIFANVVLGDEINRAGPKTQSALLECMEERTVTIDRTTHELARPFMVIATQNPIELEGTFALPEAQRDRFLLRIAIGYPDIHDELEILRNHGRGEPLEELEPVCDAATVVSAIGLVRNVHASELIEQYVVALCRATRSHPEIELGASPRAALGLLRAARANAAISGRNYVVPDDVKALAEHVLRHRLVLTTDAEIAGRQTQGVIADVVEGLPAPTGTGPAASTAARR